MLIAVISTLAPNVVPDVITACWLGNKLFGIVSPVPQLVESYVWLSDLITWNSIVSVKVAAELASNLTLAPLAA